MITRLLGLIFPTRVRPSSQQVADEQNALKADVDAIRLADWSHETDEALAQAAKHAEGEHERRRIAEGKASTYLAVLAAFIPVVLTIEGAEWGRKAGPAPEWLRLTLLVIAVGYTGAAGFQAFSALRVTMFHTVGESDIVRIWGLRDPKARMTAELLANTRRSRQAVNGKVTRVILAQENLLRAFLTFILLLVMDPVFGALRPVSYAKLDTPTEAPKAQGSVVNEVRIMQAPSCGSLAAPGSAGASPPATDHERATSPRRHRARARSSNYRTLRAACLPAAPSTTMKPSS